MKEYEVTIERLQPPCGGKDTRKHEILEIQAESPMAFLKQREPNASEDHMTISTEGDELVVVIDYDKYHIEYRFTEI